MRLPAAAAALAALALLGGAEGVVVANCAVYGKEWGHVDTLLAYFGFVYWNKGPGSLAGALEKPPDATPFNFTLTQINSQCQRQGAFESAIQAFSTAEARPDVIVGCLCSSGSLSVGRFSTTFSVPMLVTASQSSLLSNKEEYPNLFRMCTTELTDADLHSGLMPFLGISKITVAYVDSERGVKQKDRFLWRLEETRLDVVAHVVRVPDVDTTKPDGNVAVTAALQQVRHGTSYVIVYYTGGSFGSEAEWLNVVVAHRSGILNNNTVLLLPETTIWWLSNTYPDTERAISGALYGAAKAVPDRMAAMKAWAKTVPLSDLRDFGLPDSLLPDTQRFLSDIDARFNAWMAFRFETVIALFLVLHDIKLAGQEATPAAIEAKVQGLEMKGIMGDLAWDATRDRLGLVYDLLQFQELPSGGFGPVSVGEMVLSPGPDGRYKVTSNDKLIPHAHLYEARRCPDGMDKPFPYDTEEQCRPCAPGLVSSAETRGACQPCSLGLFAEEAGQGRCRPCPAGRFANGTGSLACLACMPGSAQSEPGATKCETCPRGKAAAGNASEDCGYCTRGNFQPEEGQLACLTCEGVMPGSSTEYWGAEDQGDCVCKEGDMMQRPSPSGRPRCEHCPSWLECPGGNGAPLSGRGFFVGEQAFPGALPGVIVRCSSDRVCPGGRVLGSCPPHRKGLACNECEPGYTNEDGACVPCGTTNHFWVLLAVAAAGIVFLTFLVLVNMGQNYVRKQHVTTIILVASLFVASLQTLSSFSRIRVAWIEPAGTLIKHIGVLNLDMASLQPGCLLSVNDPAMVFLVAMLAYPAVALLLSLAFLMAVLCSQRPLARDRFLNAHGFLLMACYLPLCLASFVPWQCEENPDGSTSVAQARSVLCWNGGDHAMMIAASLAGLVFYVAGFLSIVLAATYLYPAYLARPGGIGFLRRCSFLFGRFEPRRYYYGAIFSVRSFLISVLPVLLVNQPHAQVVTVSVVITGVLAVEAFIQPWRVPACNYLSVAVHCVTLHVIVGGATLLDADSRGKAVLRLLLVTGFGLLFIIGALMLAFAVRKMLVRGKRYGAFICHHKGGAGTLARVVHLVYSTNSTEHIFIDADYVGDLDKLFVIVASDVSNLVVVWTRETLSCMWCAGEITTAYRNKVNIVPLACDDYYVPKEDFLRNLPTMWTLEERNRLSEMGVEVEHIQEAYRNFRIMEPFHLRRSARPRAQEEAIQDTMRRSCVDLNIMSAVSRDGALGKLASWGAPLSNGKEGDLGQVAIIGHHKDPEALSACMLLQSLMLWGCKVDASIVVDVAKEAAGAYSHVLALLSRGVLVQPHFAAFLTLCHEIGVPVIPVHIDSSFTFPTDEFWRHVKDGAWQHVGEGTAIQLHHPLLMNVSADRIVTTYKALLKGNAKTLCTHGSQRLLLSQARDICWRLVEPANVGNVGNVGSSGSRTSRSSWSSALRNSRSLVSGSSAASVAPDGVSTISPPPTMLHGASTPPSTLEPEDEVPAALAKTGSTAPSVGPGAMASVGECVEEEKVRDTI